MSRRDAGELLLGREVVQLFRATSASLGSISPLLATYCRVNTGSVTISLHRFPPKPAIVRRLAAALRSRLRSERRSLSLGQQLAVLTAPCDALIDSEAVDVALGPLTTSPGELLALRIRTKATRTGSAPTVWLADDGERMPGHVACYVGGEGQGEYGVQATITHGGLEAETCVPQAILYSPISQCNLNCIHCVSRDSRASANRLPDHIKAQLREWCDAGHIEMLDSDYSGDILWADSRFGGELDFIVGLGIPFHINTNGVCLTAEISERLCRTRLFALNISLDAAEDETFRRVRKGAPPLQDVIQNIVGLLRARAAAGATFKVSISFTLMRSTLGEWPDFLRMGARLGVDCVIARHLEAYTADMEEDSLWHDRAAYNAAHVEALTLAETLGITLVTSPPFGDVPRTGRKPCSIPWTSAVMLGNGDVAACCVPGLVMGNLHENSMQEIWNGPRYRKLRATVNSNTPPAPCAACPIFRQTDNADSYLIYSARRRLNAEGSAQSDTVLKQHSVTPARGLLVA